MNTEKTVCNKVVASAALLLMKVSTQLATLQPASRVSVKNTLQWLSVAIDDIDSKPEDKQKDMFCDVIRAYAGTHKGEKGSGNENV